VLFRKKPKPPLTEAIRLVQQAVTLVHAYWRDRDYQPSRSDLALLRRLEDMLFCSHSLVRRIGLRMERRFHGEPDVDERKWSR